MRDRIGDHEDRIDSIFFRLKKLEDEAHPPVNWKEQIDDFKDQVKQRILDFDFWLNELELQLEEIKQRNKPRKKKG